MITFGTSDTSMSGQDIPKVILITSDASNLNPNSKSKRTEPK